MIENLLKQIPAKAWLILSGSTLLGVSGVVAFRQYQDALREQGRREVVAIQAQQRIDSLTRALHVQQIQTARAETVVVKAVQHFTKTVTQWKTDTIRESYRFAPDSSFVPVTEYRRLSGALDSVASAAAQALAAADSVAAMERREKLLWQGLSASWERKATAQTPTIVLAPRKWQHRGEGFVGGLLAAGAAFLVTR